MEPLASTSPSTVPSTLPQAQENESPPPKRIIKLILPGPLEEGGLYNHEKFWRDYQKWFEERGYMLRPRYRSDWVPSWTGTKYRPKQCEDGLTSFVGAIMDAKRVSDDTIVILKRIEKPDNPDEVEISQLFSTEPMNSDPRNHCVQVYEVLESPIDTNVVFLVIPYLQTYNYPRFATVGEAVEYFRQLFEGVQFIHHHQVAHRDIKTNYVMMDATPLVSEPYHPFLPNRSYDAHRKVIYSTRTKKPVKYYIIDFGISRRYPDDCISPREVPEWGGIKTVPEFQHSDEPRDPFPTDILLPRRAHPAGLPECRAKSAAFSFMQALVADMVQDDPDKRPTIDEVVARFDKIRASLGAWTLRSRVVHRKDNSIVGFFRTIRHAYRTALYIATRTPAIPTPPPP